MGKGLMNGRGVSTWYIGSASVCDNITYCVNSAHFYVFEVFLF